MTQIQRGVRFSPAFRDGARWQGFVLIALGWSGVGLTYGISSMVDDPGGKVAVLSGAVVSVAALAAVARGIVIVNTAARSAMRHVFRSRPLFRNAATLLAIAVIAMVALIVRDPFDGLGAHGKPLAELASDLTFVAASLICVVGGVVANREASKARRNERALGGHIAISGLKRFAKCVPRTLPFVRE